MMQEIIYFVFCGLCLGGALGVLIVPGYVNSAMSMLVSMLGVAGLLLLMEAYFLAFVVVMVYAGAVMVLFVFVVMFVGDRRDNTGFMKKVALVLLWVGLGIVLGLFEPEILKGGVSEALKSGADRAVPPAVSVAKNYGISLFTTFMLPFQVAGVLLLAAMVGIVAVAKRGTHKKRGGMESA